MSEPDFRALCAELTDRLLRAITSSRADDFYHEDRDATDRTRAALSQPASEPPTDEEFYQFWESHPELGVTCDEPVKMLRAGYNWRRGND